MRWLRCPSSRTSRSWPPSSGARACPELLRVPDLAGNTAGRGSVPSYPAVEQAVRALSRVVEYAAWLAPAARRGRDPRRHRPRRRCPDARRAADGLARGSRPDLRGVQGAARPLRHRPVGPDRGRPRADEAVRAAEALGWDVVLKATAEPLRQRPDLGSRLAQHRRRRRDAARLRLAGQASSPRSTTPGFVVMRTAPPGVPVRHRRPRGPAVRARRSRSRSPGRSPSWSATRPTGSRRSPAWTPPRRSARSRPRRCCSGTAAASRSTWTRSRTCSAGSRT